MAVPPPSARPRAAAPRRRPRRARASALVGLALAVLVAMAAPAAGLVTGVDVASFQHPDGQPIDWRAVRAAGHSFAFVKATEGTRYTNPWFEDDWRAAGSAGLYRGAYHFAKPALPLSTAVDQARYFVSRTGSMQGALDLPAVLDLETTGGLGRQDLAEWTRRWLAEVRRLTGSAPIIYTGYYFWRDSVGDPADIGAQYRLWLPSYPNNPDSTTFRPSVPTGWGTWTFWQYSSTGTVPGIVGQTDMNRFCCDPGSLAALAGGGKDAGGGFGAVETFEPRVGGVDVGGWAIDPDTTGPIDVHVYAGSRGTALRADQPRSDVGRAYPGYGERHGFRAVVPADPGAQTVCAYAIDVGGGPNRTLGCRDVFVPGANTTGYLDVARGVPGNVEVSGWSIDTTTAAPNRVHVDVDGRRVTIDAAGRRPDVGRAYPGYGPDHGFSALVPAGPGPHRVCLTGVDVAPPGGDAGLGCATVVVPGGQPVGYLDSVDTAFGLVRLTGWSLDPDSPAPTDVHVYVNAIGTPTRADRPRPDVATVFGLDEAAGHGFDVIVRRDGPGPNLACAYGINVPGTPGGNSLIGCRVV